MYDDELIPNDYDEIVVVSYDPECELQESIIDQEEYDRKENIIDYLDGILGFVYHERNEEYSGDQDEKEELRHEVEEVDEMLGDDGVVLFCQYIHKEGPIRE